jgi:hypothetical protein
LQEYEKRNSSDGKIIMQRNISSAYNSIHF